MTDPTLRNSLTRPLTWTELDANFTTLQDSGNINFTQSGTGAVVRTVQQKLRSLEVNAAEWGVVGDGVTDDGPALIAMRDDLMALGDCRLRIKFEAGDYVYTRPDWLRGLRNVVVDAWGATFKNIQDNGATNDIQKQPLVTNVQPFYGVAFSSDLSGTQTKAFGYLINTAAAGDSSVTCTTAGEAANFAAGDRVMIYGWAQMNSSYPPSPRYIDYARVVSAVAGTGVVTLDRDLSHYYDSTWWDFADGKGAPRIINLDRAEYIHGSYLEWNGGSILLGTQTLTNPHFEVSGYERAVLNDVFCECGLVPSCCDMFIANNCRFDSSYIEVDKCLGTVIFDNCDIGRISAATGVDYLILRNGTKVRDQFGGNSARNLIIDGATITGRSVAVQGAVLGFTSNYAIRSVDIRNLHAVVDTTPTTTAMIGVIAANVERTFTISNVNSNTSIDVAAANDAAAEIFYQSFEVGRIVKLQDGSKRCVITNITKKDATTITITGEFDAAPLGTEVYRMPTIKHLRIGSISQSGAFGPIPIIARIASNGLVGVEQLTFQGRTAWEFSDKEIPRQASVSAQLDFFNFPRASIRRICVNVTKAYTGASATALLRVLRNTPSAVSFALINLKTAGYREVTPTAIIGAVAGDTILAGGLDADTTLGDPVSLYYVDSFNLRVDRNSGGAYVAYADATELATFTVRLEFDFPWM